MSRICALALALAGPVCANLVKQSLQNVDKNAVCTDGTPAVYYFKPSASLNDGTGSGGLQASNTWIFYLEGGGWCYDVASCQARCGTDGRLCTSKDAPSSLALAGIFSDRTSPVLQEANKVYVRYCTSDGHMGNATKFGWQFRGHVVVQAVLRDIVATHGLGAGSQKHTLIFGGGSAGGRGAMVHLDYVSEMLGSASKNVDIVGFLDSPAWIDIPSFSKSFPGFPYIVQQVHSFANVQHLGTECATKYATAQWKCMYGEYRLPTLKTKYMVVASQADAYQLENEVRGALKAPRTIAAKAYLAQFANRTRALMTTIKESNPENAVFSWSCYNHCVSASSTGYGRLTCDPSGTTMGTALHQFLGLAPKSTTPALQWEDECTGFACGKGCSATTRASVVV